jgi:tetratricopeptide (TPR) repeat protein
MNTLRSYVAIAVLFLLSACASLQVGSDVTYGRQAFLTGNNEAAVSYFQRAAKTDPNYVYGSNLRQGIWSYVGRSEYAVGRLPQARESLQRALSANAREDIARVYLGLTLARAGDRQTGVKEIESGMRGINDWLEYVNETHRYSFGQYWDPSREIRSTIQSDLTMISGKNLDWERLVANAEWLGKRMEEEADHASRHESRDRSRDSEGKGGDHP